MLKSPPDKLPETFLEIWTLLAEEEASVGSRQKLANRLHISTGTLQRILVSGDIPDFCSLRNNRVLNAWSRTVIRLARYFNRKPEAWILPAGLPWTDTQKHLYFEPDGPVDTRRRTDRKQTGSSTGQSRQTVLSAESDRSPIEAFINRIGIADFEPLSISLPGYRNSFLEEFALRLIGVISPATRLRFQPMDSLAMLNELARPEPFFTIGIGALISASRLTNGVRFVEIPGLRVRLGAVWLRSPEDTHPSHPSPRYAEAIQSFDQDGPLFVVTAGAVTYEYLAGLCRIPEEQLLVRSPETCSDPIALLALETRRHPDRRVIMMAAENQCYNMLAAFENRETAGDFRMEMLQFDEGDLPSYPVGIVLHRRAHHLIPLFRSALELDIFGAGMRLTAGLYATLAAADIHRRRKHRKTCPLIRHTVHLAHGPLSGPEFQAEFFRALTRVPPEIRLSDSLESYRFFASGPVLTAGGTSVSDVTSIPDQNENSNW